MVGLVFQQQGNVENLNQRESRLLVAIRAVGSSISSAKLSILILHQLQKLLLYVFLQLLRDWWEAAIVHVELTPPRDASQPTKNGRDFRNTWNERKGRAWNETKLSERTKKLCWSKSFQRNEDCILSLSSNWVLSKLQIAIAGVNRSALTTWSAPSIPPSSPSMSRLSSSLAPPPSSFNLSH